MRVLTVGQATGAGSGCQRVTASITSTYAIKLEKDLATMRKVFQINKQTKIRKVFPVASPISELG